MNSYYDWCLTGVNLVLMDIEYLVPSTPAFAFGQYQMKSICKSRFFCEE